MYFLHLLLVCSSKLIIPWGEDGAIGATTDGDIYTANICPIEKIRDTLGAGIYYYHSVAIEFRKRKIKYKN